MNKDNNQSYKILTYSYAKEYTDIELYIYL